MIFIYINKIFRANNWSLLTIYAEIWPYLRLIKILFLSQIISILEGLALMKLSYYHSISIKLFVI